MIIILLLTLISVIYLVAIILIAAGFYKEPILHHFERYAEVNDSYHLTPPLLFGMGLISLFGGILFSATVAPRYPPIVLGVIFMGLAYGAHEYQYKLEEYPHIFLAFPRWYVDLRENTT